MLLQTNSYIVPKEKRAAHNHLMQRFRQVLQRIGCDHFEVYEQVGANWNGIDAGGRFVQIMRFRDRKHCQAVQLAEKQDAAAQAVVREFCDLINFPYQQEQGLFAHGYYQAVIDPIRTRPGELAYYSTEPEDLAKARAQQRIAAGLPDAPHSIDDVPQEDVQDLHEKNAKAQAENDGDEAVANSIPASETASDDFDELALDDTLEFEDVDPDADTADGEHTNGEHDRADHDEPPSHGPKIF